jgi:peptidoglycan/LPS O-acetylase OafA/YrhL
MCHAIGGVLSLKFLVKMDTSPLGFFLNGNAALMYFFVLSGFVLSLPFIDNKQPLNITAFYTRRIFRIYPAFIAAILLAIVLKTFIFQPHVVQNAGAWFNQRWLWEWNAASVKEVLRTLCLVHPAMDTNFIDPPIWSLVVEMKMSLILPFFILLVSRCNLAVNIALFFIIYFLDFS